MSRTSPMLEKAIARLETFNQDEDAYLDAVKEYFHCLDEATFMEQSEQRGLKRGLELGRLEGMREGERKGKLEGMREGEKKAGFEIARNLKVNNIDITVIMNSTGLSKEEIDKL